MYRLQLVLLCFVGIGALFGGGMALLDPTGALYGAPTGILRRGPFTTFLIPGLFLFFVLGCGHLIAFLFTWRKLKFHVYLGGGAGCILMAWILIQCYVLQAVSALHVIFFVLGAVEGGIALSMLIKQHQFPFDRGTMAHKS